ncbi:MAG: hypothetical protein CMJ18_10140 [Phycisphaeraceae bacterium]|nr:hypothetical protein [Phycisphaeraceae bacterium]
MKRLVTSCAVIVSLAVAIGVAARPFLPQSPKLPDKLRSLAGLKEVRLRVEIPDRLVQIGITPSRIQQRCEVELRKVDIKIVSDLDTPEMIVKVMHLTEPEVPGAFAFNGRVSVKQRVVVPRIEQTIEAETFSVQMLGINKDGAARETIGPSILELLRRTTIAMQVATRHWEAEKREAGR